MPAGSKPARAMSLTSQCGVCTKTVKEGCDKVICYGPCGLIMHLKCCAEMDKNSLTAMKENCYLKYLCHDCRKNQCCYNNVIQMCNEILTKMSEDKEEVMHLLAKLEGKVEAQGESINSKIKNECEKVMEVCRKSGATKKSVQQIAKTTEITTQQESLEKISFADAVKNQPSLPNVKMPVIIVKPKEKVQSTKATKIALQSKVDRKQHNINEVREGNNGTIILGLKNSDQVEAAVTTVREQLGEDYLVSVPKPKKPRLKIVGVEEKLDEEGLKNSVAGQNVNLEDIELRVITCYSSTNTEGSTYNYVIEADETSHEIMLEAGHLYIGWSRCKVFECFGIIRCFKCCGYGHKSMECQKGEICAKCAEKHKTKECNSTVARCANCEEVNRIRKLNLKTDHHAFSRECATYKRHVARKRHQMDNC